MCGLVGVWGVGVGLVGVCVFVFVCVCVLCLFVRGGVRGGLFMGGSECGRFSVIVHHVSLQ